MKRFLSAVLCAFLSAALAGCWSPGEDPSDPTVYIGTTSAHYHSEGCSALGSGGKSYPESKVVAQGYKPCPHCQDVPPPPKQPAVDPTPQLQPAPAQQSQTYQQPAVQQRSPAAQQPAATSEQVFTTKTGKKYHRGNCRYLRQSKIPISKADAQARGLEPCSVCKP